MIDKAFEELRIKVEENVEVHFINSQDMEIILDFLNDYKNILKSKIEAHKKELEEKKYEIPDMDLYWENLGKIKMCEELLK